MPKDRFGIVDEYVSGCVGPASKAARMLRRTAAWATNDFSSNFLTVLSMEGAYSVMMIALDLLVIFLGW
jgi:hypothetical protein